MGDPFSIASGVAGLVSLGLTLCNGLHVYFSAIKDRGEDIESASQLLALLRSNIDIIGSSSSTLSNRYSKATQGITAGLKLCQHQLKALDKVVNSLNVPNGIPNARRWQKQKAVVTYPFNRHKLLQVQDQLLKATGVLGTFVQTLILNINVNMGDDLQAVRNAMKNSSLVTDDFLRNVNDSIDIIGPSIQQTETQLTTISARVDEQTALASTTHALVHEVNLKLSTLASGVEEIRISSHTNKDQSIESNPFLQLATNVETEPGRNHGFLAEKCNCRPSRTRPAYRRFRQGLQSWGWITVSKRVELQEGHRPGCPFYTAYSSKESTTTTVTYTGLRHFFSRVLDLSLVRDGRAGAYSVSYGLRIYNVVESSPVFDVFQSQTTTALIRDSGDTTKTVLRVKNELQLLYASHRASPFDVDESGRNIAHDCMLFGWALQSQKSTERVNKGLATLRMLLVSLSDIGVNINAANFNQRTIVDIAVGYRSGNILSCVYDTLEECDPQHDLVMNPNDRWWRSWIDEWQTWPVKEFPDIFFERADIVQGLGYGDLFQAISQKDERKLQVILDKERLLDSLFDRDFYGRNALHLCTSWSTGLRLLLRNQATKPLLIEQDNTGLVPSDHALISSHCVCNAPDKWNPCHNCDCSPALQILLEVDCRVVITHDIGRNISNCSLKAKILILEHLRKRRERLLRVAINSLYLTDLKDLGVVNEKPSDTRAKELWDKLCERGVELEDALNPRRHTDQLDYGGLFFEINCPKVAELAFNMGFEDIDAPSTFGLTPILAIELILEPPNRIDDVGPLAYAAWLLQRGARIDRSINSFGISAAHYLARLSGVWFRRHYLKAINTARSLPSELARLFSKLFRIDEESCFPCPCTPRGLSRPLHHFLVGVLDGTYPWFLHRERCRTYRDEAQLAVHLVNILTYVDGLDVRCLTTPIIRLLTLESLNIRHLRQCRYKPDQWIRDRVLDSERQEEWNEMLDEDQPLIKQLDELMEEFEAKLLGQNVPITTFLRGYWLKRMRQVRRERAKPLSEEQKQGLRDAGVILGEADQWNVDWSDYLSTETEDNYESESDDGDEYEYEEAEEDEWETEEEDYTGEYEDDSEENEK
ncbi:hypothetical protein NM208_g778 [Fusarium decemcellulare]|uniref:Uncharacterized protein n=1 Tax=Fusarium decemcellulare TaxID=57161 RepID=A0ACC1SYK4_9HYPO|nr:hypothetical protein NM208_g778 [Fusarium decemcellulare]